MTEKKRGFAALTPERLREIARKGGKSAHAMGVAHEWSSEDATAAGRKGGFAVHQRRQAAKKTYDDTAETIPAPPPTEPQ